jgi:hypothetical protein
MFVGVAVPLVVLLVVIAGVAWGVHRSNRPAATAGTRGETLTARPAPPIADRSGLQTMPLALGAEAFACKVAGTSYRQDTLAALRAELLRVPKEQRVGGRRGAFIAELRPDPDNPHDPDAVSVEAPGFGTVGWLPRGDGARYIPLLQSVSGRGLRPRCPAEVCKGPDGALAVRLDLAAPAAVAARLHISLNDIANPAMAGRTNNHPLRLSN